MSHLFNYIFQTWPSWLCASLVPAVAYLYGQVRAMRRGIRALLRADIIRLYNKYHDDLGYCPIYVKTALQDEYDQYHLLRGNGVITNLYNELMELPTEPAMLKPGQPERMPEQVKASD